ncbi:hypothetical protein M436DRAFT_51880 [Aureobasidium namibiae CBS 147.97]|uniref:von Willebrand and RING finger domain-containing protein n=1 Tax=Aureobasidium namibiae CBS 147.97 TaxID=1043004 RepID=A0A074X8I5_9PEZI|nr:uncharacterized protein M436DRAFT_51880 [Aureobasidium namibiae CBS 147.97]KEQ70946.1 hypothetical protein M436DRAFT_51880 [Aureobasidium namibiae CBS 147.97]
MADPPQHSFASVFRPGSRSSTFFSPSTHTATITATPTTTPKTTTRRFASLRGGSNSSRLKKQQAQNLAPAPPSTSHDELGDMIDATGPKSRRERTLIGTECAACEEPLEHTLRGERILQLSCGHVAHEACFYEFIKEFESQECPSCNAPLGLDTSRGGNLNFGNTNPTISTALSVADNLSAKLNNLVNNRSANSPDLRDRTRDSDNNPTPWDDPPRHTHQTYASTPSHAHHSHDSVQSHAHHSHNSVQTAILDPSPRPPTQASFTRSHQHSNSVNTHNTHLTHTNSHHTRSVESRQHERNNSQATDESRNRRIEYDLQSIAADIPSPRPNIKNPIPAPTVTVRTEFPTLNRSRQQQSLTCLITVEVVDGKWRPDPEDIVSPAADSLDNMSMPRSPDPQKQFDLPHTPSHVLDRVTEDLHTKVDNWHGLDFSRFGRLLLHGTIRVGKDRQSWQDLECYLFTEMLICIKEKKPQNQWETASESAKMRTKCTLKGSILIKRHLKQVQFVPDHDILTLNLSVAELPHFHLQFHDRSQLDIWRRALISINNIEMGESDEDFETSGTEDEDLASRGGRRSSIPSSYGAGKSAYTAPTEYTSPTFRGTHGFRLPMAMHVPLDIVVVVPLSSSMQGLKISLLRDVLRFLVNNLGEQDRMGLVTYGSSGGSMPVVGMTSKNWNGWSRVFEAIKPIGQKSLRADVVDGANVAMDLLMQRKAANPISGVMLISDSTTSEIESVDFVVSRAEAAKIAIHSFGLGLTHKPDTMIELSTRTKATYTYVKDWMMLRECVAGCLGSLQSVSHQNAKLKLRLPEGSPAKFVKISGALQITKRATGRDAEASLGDLRFGDRRDILVQLAISPDNSTPEQDLQDPWETIVSGLEALGGPLDQDDMRPVSVEEVPLIQADLAWGDILREGNVTQLPRPSLLAITMLPPVSKKASMSRAATPPIPPHPSVVQRRMELLTSDMLTRALTLVSRGQHERACHLLTETRSILKGLGKGGLPPLPPPSAPPTAHYPPSGPPTGPLPPPPIFMGTPVSMEPRRTPTPPRLEPLSPFTPAAGIDADIMSALDTELAASLEWINHPAVFGRDSRKAVLQAIGVISSQRGFTMRTPAESLWATRVPGTRRLNDRSREWRETGDELLAEES